MKKRGTSEPLLRAPQSAPCSRLSKRRSGGEAADKTKSRATRRSARAGLQARGCGTAEKRRIAPRRGKSKPGCHRARNSRTIVAERFQFLARSDGISRRYGPGERGIGDIPAPGAVTWQQLYVNGMLQPEGAYSVEPGRITLLARDLPASGTPIQLESYRLSLAARPCRKASSRSGRESITFPWRDSYFIASTRKGEDPPMPPSLIKPFMIVTSTVSGTVDTTTVTSVDDVATRFNATVTAPMIDAGAGTVTIPAESFFDDAGNPVPTGSLPPVSAGGYVNVYINGMLQQEALTATSPTTVVIASAALLPGTPVILEFHSYAGTTSTSTSVPSLTVDSTVTS
ncbi:DUF4183 domain-containing protein [Paenibacillus albicereus]|uniref:DUF4183 domain-containing protein n=1 Tax=Paenibacillus albicereus TaxID=2726185 RepID=A0A6H2H104_9BACL|nr:DUF4183 domain-containing protein [Paenibacillus albicereus]QJC53364.1 DUF4183 domain-containing protein [Paenibacillus albicereus]